MATSGAAAWQKYFRGKGDIETRLKKDSEVFDVQTKAKLSYKLSNGAEVVYMKATAYDSKAIVRTKKGNSYVLVRVPFDNIAKPGVKSSGAASLKPQAFGVSDKIKYPIVKYAKLIKDNIGERKDLSVNIKTYLNALVDHSMGKIKDQQISSVYKKVESDLPLNDIKKDFGEVIGPIAVHYLHLFKPKNIRISDRMTVEVPLRPNEPLMDYAIYEGSKKYIISAKSGETTNVVKPKDILDLLEKDPAKVKKWKKTKEYNVLKILSENSTLIGPLKAVGFMSPSLIKESTVGEDERSFNISSVASFISKNDYLKSKKKPTLNEVMYECEKFIRDQSVSGGLDINSIFADAIEGAVIYVKFDITINGVSEWDVIVSGDIKKIKSGKKAFLRTKNGYTRAADRMGVQI